MKKIIIYMFLVLVSQFSLAQINCLENEIQTNPASPSNPGSSQNPQNQTPTGEPWLNNGDFNWLTDELIPYYRTGTNQWQAVLSPFEDTGNENIDYISVPEIVRDNKPEDGWELITYRLGYEYLNSPVTIPDNVPSSALLPVSHPSFILYNKYTGLLRIFIFLNKQFLNDDYDTASILLRHEGENIGEKENALFTFSEPIAWALDDFKKRYSFEAANMVTVDDGYWLIGDFPMAYDPCVCNHSSNLLIKSELIDIANVNLTGNIITENLVNVTADKTTQNITSNPDYKAYFGRVSDAVKAGLKKYKEIDGFASQIQKLIPKEKSEKKKEESSFSLVKLITNLFKGSQEVETSKPKDGGIDFLKNIPKIGGLIGFLDFFVMGGKSGSNANKGGVTPVSFEANINMSGTIKKTGEGPAIKLATPGSKYNPSNQDIELPMYNEALGVFNLVKTPRIEMVTYHPFNSNNGTIKQYKVAEDLSYALNPAADLEIMDIKATLIVSYEPSIYKGDFITSVPQNTANLITDACLYSGDNCPFPKPINENRANITSGLTFDDLDEMGYGIETMTEFYPGDNSSARLNIGYLPIGCFQDASFLISGGINNRYEQPKIYCKIAITFKREDDPNAQPIDMVVTYNTDIYSAPDSPLNTWEYDFTNDKIVFSSSVNPGGKVYPTPLLLPLKLKFEAGDVVGPGLIESRGAIVIEDGATILPGTHLIAPEIDINATVDIPSDAFFQIGQPNTLSTCGANPVSNFRQTDFTSICDNTNLYNPIILTPPALISNESESFYNQNHFNDSDYIKIIDVKVFPNPFDNNLSIAYQLSSNSDVKFILQNSLGQMVKEKNITQQAGEQLEIIRGNDLPDGIYYLTIRTTDSIKTIKVSKQRK